jgi:hypothetical protein
MYNQGTIMDLVYAAQREARIAQERGDYLYRLLRSTETQIDILKGENEFLKRKLQEASKGNKGSKASSDSVTE